MARRRERKVRALGTGTGFAAGISGGVSLGLCVVGSRVAMGYGAGGGCRFGKHREDDGPPFRTDFLLPLPLQDGAPEEKSAIRFLPAEAIDGADQGGLQADRQPRPVIPASGRMGEAEKTWIKVPAQGCQGLHPGLGAVSG